MINFLLQQKIILLALVPILGISSTLIVRILFAKYRNEIFSIPLMTLMSILIMAFFLVTIGIQTGSYYEWARTYIGTLPISIILLISIHVFNAYLIFRDHNYESKRRETKDRFLNALYSQFDKDFPDEEVIAQSGIEHMFRLVCDLPLSDAEREYGFTSMPLSEYVHEISAFIDMVNIQQSMFKKNIDINHFEDNEFVKFILMGKNPKYSFQQYCFHSDVEGMYKKDPKNTLFGHFLNVLKQNKGQKKLISYLNSHSSQFYMLENITIMNNGETAFFDAICVLDDHLFAFTAKDFSAHSILINFDGKMFVRQSSRDKGEVTSLVQNIERKSSILRNIFKNYHVKIHSYYVQTDEKTGLMNYYETNDFNASYLSNLSENMNNDMKNHTDTFHDSEEIMARLVEKRVEERQVKTIDISTLRKRIIAASKYYVSTGDERRNRSISVIENRQALIKKTIETSPRKFMSENMELSLKSELQRYEYRKSFANEYFDILDKFLLKVINLDKSDEHL